MAGPNIEQQFINELPENAAVATAITHEHKCHFVQQEAEEIIKGYTEQRLTVYQLSEKHGCHRNTISRLLKQHDVRVSNIRMTDAQIEQTIELYEVGWSLREIAKELGVCKSNVQRTLHRNGIKMRPTKRQAKQ